MEDDRKKKEYFSINKPWRSNEMVSGLAKATGRSLMWALGLTRDDFSKPFIGIVNSHTDIHPGHMHLRQLGEQVRLGIHEAGGRAFEFQTIALCDGMTMGHEGMYYVLPSRDWICDTIELMVQGNRLDGLVFIASCDKIEPAMMMAMARLDIPSIMLTGGPMMPGYFDGKPLACSSVRESAGKWAMGKYTDEEILHIEQTACPGPGSCSMSGTANTMACVAESLGWTLPGCATSHAQSTEKQRLARATGREVVRLVKEDIRPSKITTMANFKNAMSVSSAFGGSTNATLHIPAIAKQMGIHIRMDDFEAVSQKVPYMVSLIMAGKHTMLEFHEAGGVPALMKELSPHLDENTLTVTGKTLGEISRLAENKNPEVVRPLSNPYQPHGSYAIMRGSICPDGGIVKQTGVAPEMLVHEGPARVFDTEEEAYAEIFGGNITPGDVIVIRYQGPRGGPGMREMQAATSALMGVGRGKDSAIITDGRFSGGTHGPCIGHIAPEASEGGLIAYINNGDRIRIDIPGRALDLLVPQEEIDRRKREQPLLKKEIKSHVLRRYAMLVGSAAEGATLSPD